MYYLLNNKNGLGNRIYSLLHILYEASENNQKINIDTLKESQNSSYVYDYINLFNFELIQSNYNSQMNETNNNIKKDIFFPKNLHLVDKRKIDVKKYFELSSKFIKPFLNNKTYIPLDNRICVMHIRSGDEFKREFSNHTHPLYVLPPLAYYKKIIDEYNEEYDKFVIITEPDLLNPCIKLLNEYSDKIEIKCNSAVEDYIYLLRAQTLVLSWSTFSDTSVYLSPNLKNLFFWNDSHVFSDKSVLPENINVRSLKLTKPYIERGKWNGLDKKLHEIMINYKMEDVIFED
jgi:hypothetical protein